MKNEDIVDEQIRQQRNEHWSSARNRRTRADRGQAQTPKTYMTLVVERSKLLSRQTFRSKYRHRWRRSLHCAVCGPMALEERLKSKAMGNTDFLAKAQLDIP